MSEYHVFTKRGDARPEVDALLKELGFTAEDAGLHKYIFVTQVHQTAVMLAGADVPLARALRGRKGWSEPSAAH